MGLYITALPIILALRLIWWLVCILARFYFKISLYFALLVVAFLVMVTENTKHYAPLTTQVSNKPKALILSMHAGGGHKTAAHAVKEIAETNGWTADLCYSDLPYSPVYTKLASNQKSLIVSMTYGLIADLTFNVLVPMASLAYYLELKQLIAQNNYSCVIAVGHHMIPIFDYLDIDIPTIIIPTDFEGHNAWLSSYKSYYIASTPRLAEQINKIVPPSHLHRSSGMPIQAKFTSDIKPRAERRVELSLPQDTDIVLVVFGACGSYEMIQIMECVKNSNKQFIFICGKNTELMEELQQLNRDKYNNKYVVHGFVDNLHHFMQASNVVIGKPGPGIITECIAVRVPIIVTKAGVMKQELYNLTFIEENQIGIIIDDWNMNLDQIVNDAVHNPNYVENMNRIAPENNAQMDDIWQIVLKIVRDFETTRDDVFHNKIGVFKRFEDNLQSYQ